MRDDHGDYEQRLLDQGRQRKEAKEAFVRILTMLNLPSFSGIMRSSSSLSQDIRSVALELDIPLETKNRVHYSVGNCRGYVRCAEASSGNSDAN